MLRERERERESEKEGCSNSVITYLPALCCKDAGSLSGIRTNLPAL